MSSPRRARTRSRSLAEATESSGVHRTVTQSMRGAEIFSVPLRYVRRIAAMSLLLSARDAQQGPGMAQRGAATASGGISLQLSSVSKTFAGRQGTVEALRPVDLEVDAGEFVCLLGPSGCGKSTLLSIIAGLEGATTGAIWAD